MEDFNFKNLNILVTGGAGFIGSNLCDFLVQLGCKNVVCLDNFSTGCKKNIKHLLSKTNFNLIEGDIRNISDCNKACRILIMYYTKLHLVLFQDLLKILLQQMM